jgi:hypothetical protein
MISKTVVWLAVQRHDHVEARCLLDHQAEFVSLVGPFSIEKASTLIVTSQTTNLALCQLKLT